MPVAHNHLTQSGRGAQHYREVGVAGDAGSSRACTEQSPPDEVLALEAQPDLLQDVEDALRARHGAKRLLQQCALSLIRHLDRLKDISPCAASLALSDLSLAFSYNGRKPAATVLDLRVLPPLQSVQCPASRRTFSIVQCLACDMHHRDEGAWSGVLHQPLHGMPSTILLG